MLERQPQGIRDAPLGRNSTKGNLNWEPPFQIVTAHVQDSALTVSFLNEAAVGVDASATLLGLLLSQPQDVLQAIQGHLNYLRVHDGQKIAEGFNAAQVY